MKSVLFASLVVGALAIPVHRQTSSKIGAFSLEKETMHTLNSLMDHIPESMSAADKRDVMDNVNHMKADLKRIELHNEGTQKHKDILKALRMRFEALKTQMKPAGASLEKEEHATSKRTIAHLDSLVQHLPASMSTAQRRSVLENVKGMKTDLQHLQSEVGAHDANLKKALHLRFQALKEQVHAPSEADLEREEDSPFKMTFKTVDRLLHDLHANKQLSASTKAAAAENVESMKADLEKMKTTPKSKGRLTQALKLRTRLLKKQLAQNKKHEQEQPDEAVEPQEVAEETTEQSLEKKVEHSINNILHKLPIMAISLEKKKNVRSNLHAMKTDIKQMHTTSPKHAKELKKALSLRFSALKKQLDEESEEALEEEAPQEGQLSKKALEIQRSGLEMVQVAEHKALKHLSELERKVRSDTTMSPNQKHGAEQNLKEIKRDIVQIPGAQGEKKTNLEKAVHLRMKALHMQLQGGVKEHTVPASDLEAHKVSGRVMNDIAHVRQALERRDDLSDSKLFAVRQNLAAMEVNMEKQAGANEEYRSRLVKALQLRVDALKQQMKA